MYKDIYEKVYYINKFEKVYNPIEILNLAGVELIALPSHKFKKILNTHNVTCCKDSFTERTKGYNGANYTVYYNLDYPKCRINFSLWHEFAHIWLNHFQCNLNEEIKEKHANIFARLCIIPHKKFIENMHLTDDELMKMFNVSKKVIEIKRDMLETDKFYCNMLDNNCTNISNYSNASCIV